jgi:hypothetical protein
LTRTRSLLLVALAVLAGATWLGVRAYQAASHLSDARVSLEAARTHLLARDLPRAEGDLKNAAGDTSAARAATRSVIWRASARVPLIGRSFRSVSIVAAAADDVTHRTLPTAVDTARRLDPDKLRRADGSIDIGLLRAARPGVDEALHSSAGAYAWARSAPDSLLLPYAAHARSRFLGSAQRLTAALLATRRALDLAPALLGEDRPRHYFVAVQQNAEARGTGGLIGGFAVIEARAGRFRVISQGSDRDLYQDERPIDPPPGLPTGYTRAYGFYSVFAVWRNINIAPQLPAAAKLIEAKWRVRTGQRLDGVIALDGNALREILLGTDPINVGGSSIQPKDIADYLAIGQYQNVSIDEASTNRRKDSLEQVSQVVLQRVTTTGKDSGLLLQGLVRAIRSGHLRMASDDPALAGLHASGIDGSLPTGSAPIAFPSIYNAQGSKLDLWLDRNVQWRCGSHGRATVTVTLRDDVPDGELPPYIGLDLRQNPKVVITKTDAVHLDLYVTKGATLVSAERDGKALKKSEMTSGVVGGLPFWGADFELPPKTSHTLSLVLDHAATKGQVRIPEQPLARPMTRAVEGC